MRGLICPGIKDSTGHTGKLCRNEEQLVFGRRFIGQYGVENVRTNKKVYILDSDIGVKDVTFGHRESTQISGVKLPWGGPKLWFQSDLGWYKAPGCGSAQGWVLSG